MLRLKVAKPGRILIACLMLILSLSACQSTSAKGNSPVNPKATEPSIPVNPTVRGNSSAPSPVFTTTAATRPTATPPVQTLGLPDDIPQDLRDAIKLPEGWSIASNPETASVRLDLATAGVPDPNAISWVYALVAPFPTVADDLSLIDLQKAWKEGPSSSMPFQTLLVDPSTRAVFEKAWGSAASTVKTLPKSQLLDTAWSAKTAWAIVPFEQIEPRWKVISVDGNSPIQKAFQPERYGLLVHFALQGPAGLRASLLASGPLAQPNRRADHLTTVMVTGVTALVRGTASFMEGRGLDYPAQFIGDWLREADILHVSNEVAFAKNCPPPFDWVDLKFCSRPKYMQLLKDVGVDVVELSGDHFDDWGPEAVLYSLQMYKDAGMKYYGGGANIEEARQPALFDHNGNKIAFIGCNAKPPGYAKASDTYPGAIHCDMDQMASSVKKLRADGYNPIVTFQHLEYYSYEAHPILQKDFRQMADAGAVIVSGSQAHQPHAMEFKDDGFLHYGLGNLFFDQTNQGDAPRTAFIDRHVFYEGKHISTELLTIYLIDYARSRPMTLPERQTLLKTVFQASGW